MLGEEPWYAYLGASADADRVLSATPTEPVVSAHSGDAPLRELILAADELIDAAWDAPGLALIAPIMKFESELHKVRTAPAHPRPEPREWR